MKNIFGLFVSILLVYQTGYCITVKDSIPVRIVAHKYNSDFTSLDSIVIDTTLKHFQIYNFPFTKRALPIFLGNPGLSYTSALYSDRTELPDFLFSHYVSYNFHQPENIIYYRTLSPYTNLSYFTSGPKSRQEQKLSIIHTQNITKNVNVGFLGDLDYSDGQFVNQRTRLHAFSLFTSYTGQRYRIYGSLNLNSLKLQENGGIQNDSIYRQSEKSIAVPVNLEYANTTLKNQTIFFFHRFYITGSYKSDSLHNSSKWNEAVSIIHQFKFDRNYRSYRDQLTTTHQNSLGTSDRDFYRNAFIDTTQTQDSVYFRRYENVIQLAINTNQWLKVPAELRFGIKNQLDKYSFSIPVISGEINTTGNFQPYFYRNNPFIQTIYGRKGSGGYIINNALVASLTNHFSKTIRWGAYAESYFTGYKAGDFELRGDIEKSIWGNFILKVSGKLSSVKPGYFIQEYSSNHFQWNNSFDRQKSTSLRAGLYLKKFKFSLEAQSDNLFGYVYFNSLAVPVQSSLVKGFTVSSLTLNKLIDWGIFHTDIRLTFQQSGDTAAVSIPYFSGFNSTYLGFDLFKKVMKLQLGLDVFYNSSFYANAYMPATGMFYSQKKTENSDYPYINVFLNIKVKRLRFFIEYERVNSFNVHTKDYLPNHYGFFLPQYPYNPDILKYGLSWTFYD